MPLVKHLLLFVFLPLVCFAFQIQQTRQVYAKQLAAKTIDKRNGWLFASTADTIPLLVKMDLQTGTILTSTPLARQARECAVGKNYLFCHMTNNNNTIPFIKVDKQSLAIIAETSIVAAAIQYMTMAPNSDDCHVSVNAAGALAKFDAQFNFVPLNYNNVGVFEFDASGNYMYHFNATEQLQSYIILCKVLVQNWQLIQCHQNANRARYGNLALSAKYAYLGINEVIVKMDLASMQQVAVQTSRSIDAPYVTVDDTDTFLYAVYISRAQQMYTATFTTITTINIPSSFKTISLINTNLWVVIVEQQMSSLYMFDTLCTSGFGFNSTGYCNPCSVGTFANQTCVACPANTYQNATNATSCIECEKLHLSAPGSVSCRQCDTNDAKTEARCQTNIDKPSSITQLTPAQIIGITAASAGAFALVVLVAALVIFVVYKTKLDASPKNIQPSDLSYSKFADTE